MAHITRYVPSGCMDDVDRTEHNTATARRMQAELTPRYHLYCKHNSKFETRRHSLINKRLFTTRHYIRHLPHQRILSASIMHARTFRVASAKCRKENALILCNSKSSIGCMQHSDSVSASMDSADLSRYTSTNQLRSHCLQLLFSYHLTAVSLTEHQSPSTSRFEEATMRSLHHFVRHQVKINGRFEQLSNQHT
jgi:hypothetical protein